MSSTFAASPNYPHASSFGGIQIPTSIAHSASTPSLPKPSAIPERKPKLRASCDACAASKVKCSKEHPICLRCSTNGTVCIYGLSRKHGKAGRVRKKNSDGPSTKPSKQRPSPNGKEFGKFRIRPEPLLPDVEEDTINETIENQNLGAIGFGVGLGIGVGEVVDLGMDTENPIQDPDSRPSFGFMDVDDILFANTSNPQSYPSPTSPEFAQTVKPELTFKDPFAKRESFPRFHTPLPSDFQALKDFIGGENDGTHGFDYALHEEHNMFGSERSSDDDDAQSPMDINPSINSLQSNITVSDPHCCYTLAYSTLESLHFRNPTGNSTGSLTGNVTSDAETQTLDSVLAACKSAVRNVMQLLSCRCANNPHLAMFYASITSKILSWYQIAAGIQKNSASAKLPDIFPTSCGLPPTPALSTVSSPSFSSSCASTPRSTTSAAATFPIKLQPLRIGLFEFDEEDQDALRRQVVLRELRKCSGLVEALANWRASPASDGESAEFLFDVLGAWLKSELFRTMREVEGEKEMG